MDIIDERNTGHPVISFTDQNGTAITPTSLTYKVIDEKSQTTIKGPITVQP